MTASLKLEAVARVSKACLPRRPWPHLEMGGLGVVVHPLQDSLMVAITGLSVLTGRGVAFGCPDWTGPTGARQAAMTAVVTHWWGVLGATEPGALHISFWKRRVSRMTVHPQH